VPLVQGGTTKQATQAALLTTTGNVTAAKLVPTGGTATGNGMYLPATNTLAWSTNGVEGIRLDASGNLGIGTSSPTFKLVAANNGTDGGWMYSSSAVSVLGLGGYSAPTDGTFQIKYDRATGTTTFNEGDRDTPTAVITLDGSGNLITTVNSTAPTLSANSTMSFELTSNTSLKIVVRGTDGVTRSVSLTLA
jgi:hypothetical protein